MKTNSTDIRTTPRFYIDSTIDGPGYEVIDSSNYATVESELDLKDAIRLKDELNVVVDERF